MKAKFGAIITAGAGGLGGHYVSGGYAGKSLRTKPFTVKTKSNSQSVSKSRFTFFAQGWKGLLQTERDAWNAAVSDYSRTDVFGDLRNPSGFNLFQRLNNILVLCGQSPLLSPPVPGSVPSVILSNVAYSISSPSMSVTFAPTLPVNTSVIVSATRPLSPGISNVNKFFRIITILPAGTQSGESVLNAYIQIFGSLGQPGQKIVVKFQPVNLLTGQVGYLSVIQASLVAPPSVALKLIFDDILNVAAFVGDPFSVSAWNALFNLPVFGNPFFSVSVSGTSPCEVGLCGGSNISLYGTFLNNQSLLSVDDGPGSIVLISDDSFANCSSLISVSFIAVLSIEYLSNFGAFENCVFLSSINFPICTSLFTGTFANCPFLFVYSFPSLLYIISSPSGGILLANASILYFPSLLSIGPTVLNDSVFTFIAGYTILLTIPTSLMSINAGNPEGDLQVLIANNNVTIVQV